MKENPTSPPSHYNLNIRVPVELIARLRERAKLEHNGVSAVARRLLTLGLRDEPAAQVKGRA